MRFAAIDVGSNAVRLLISEVTEKEHHIDFKKVLFIRVPLRLGVSVFSENKISKSKVSELVKVISAFENLIDVHKVDDMMACATAAMREAQNRKDILKKIKAETGVKIELIEGKKEAEIIYSNHIAEELDLERSYLYIDVGGGSTELTLFSNGKIVNSNSFPVGTIKMLYDKIDEKDWNEMKSWVKDLKEHKNVVAIGTGGNINKISKLKGKKENKSVTLQEIKDLTATLEPLSLTERMERYDLNEDRADVIVPAGRIFMHIMKWASIQEVYVPRIGLADGIIHHLYEKAMVKA